MDIVLGLGIATTPDRLFDAITTSKGLAGWYTSQSKAEPQKGALIEFGFGPRETITLRVDELEPRRRVVWSGVEVPPEWQGTHLAFDITPAGDLTTLRFSQTGFAPDDKVFGYFSYLWAHYIVSLKLLLETGTGEPFGSPGSDHCHAIAEQRYHPA